MTKRKNKTNADGYAALLAYFGGGKLHGAKTKMAKALGLSSRQVVDRWERRGVPMKYAQRLKELTGFTAADIWPENF